METMKLFSKSEVIHKHKEEYNVSTMLKSLEAELRLRGSSARTSSIYLYYNTKFLDYIKKSPNEITEDDIKEYLSYKLSKNVSNSTVRLISSALKFYYSEILGKNIVLVNMPRGDKMLPVVLSKKEIKHLLNKTENVKHRLLIELLYSTGIRLTECVNLKYGDLDLSENIGWIRKGKGSKDRIFIISDKFKMDLISYRKEHGFDQDGFIFEVRGKKMSPRGIQWAITMSVRRAGIKKNVHVHTLRHSFATHLLENGVDIRKIQKLLGHTNLATTQIYTQVSSQEIKKIKSPLDIL
jgi:integrase/recombinase XerD